MTRSGGRGILTTWSAACAAGSLKVFSLPVRAIAVVCGRQGAPWLLHLGAALEPGALLLGVATRYRAGECRFTSWVVILAPYVALTPCGDSTRFLLALR